MEDIEAVILTGGQGRRMRIVSNAIPKVMLPLRKKPFLEYIISHLRKQGLTDIILSVGYKSAVIKEYFGDGRRFGVRIRYCREDKPLGTGGALVKAAGRVSGSSFIAMNGDSYQNVSFKKLISFHRKKKALCSVCLRKEKKAQRYGSVRLDHNARVRGFVEKDAATAGPSWVNAGIYCFEKKIFSGYPPDKRISVEKEIFPELARSGKLYALASRASFVDIGVPEDYHAARNALTKMFI